MNQLDKKIVATLIKEGRKTKGITQQELSDLTGISLRSVQRIENEEVLPRRYTIRMLAEELGVWERMNEPILGRDDFPDVQEDPIKKAEEQRGPVNEADTLRVKITLSPSKELNRPRKIILSIGIGVLMILGTIAYIAQSARFPETDFEGSLLWMVIAGLYMLILFRLWK